VGGSLLYSGGGRSHAKSPQSGPQETVTGQGMMQRVDLEREVLVGVAGFEPAAPASRRHSGVYK
jgi:hypothetical protein